MKVDILLATYNGEKYLEQQINSILNQTYSDFNLIISDDNSLDNTIAILKEFEKKDERIKVFYQKVNLGYIKNFEFLIKKSTNNYVMLSDQDDVWEINKIKFQLKYLLSSKADLIYSDVQLVNHNLELIDESYYKSLKISPLNGKMWKNMLFRNPIIGNTVMLKKELLDEVKEIPKEIPHDWYLGIIASMKNGVKFQTVPLTKYRIHSSNTSGVSTNINSLKYKFLKFSYEDFIDWRYELLRERIEFLYIIEKNLQFRDEYKKQYNYIQKYIKYLNKLVDKKILNLNIFDFFKYGRYIDIKILNKVAFLFIFHVPCGFNLLLLINKMLKYEKEI